VKAILLRLARSNAAEVVINTVTKSDSVWTNACRAWNLPLPTGETISFGGIVFTLVWPDHFVLGATVPVGDSARGEASNQGYEIMELPAEPGDSAPERMVKLLRNFP
jgi:hypothetical protein